MNIQPQLENENIVLIPLQENDFEDLFDVASDPKIWEQHPNKDRYKREVFRNFFDGALLSKGAFKIIEKSSSRIIGSTRFYDFDDDSIFIGYTFYSTEVWGKGINPQVKRMMLDYAFQFVNVVKFHVGKENIRSRIAMERLGAEFKEEIEVAYFGESPKINIEYWIEKNQYEKELP